MLKLCRESQAAKHALGAVVLLGCSATGPLALAQPNNGVRQPLSLNSPVEKIVADPRGKAILNQDLPGLTTNPHYNLFCDMSLEQLAPMSGGKLNHENLAKVQNDLTQLAYEETAEQ